MPRGNVRVYITGDASGLSRTTRQAERNLGTFGAATSKLQGVAKATAASIGVTGLAGSIVAVGAATVGFDKAMRNVNSIAQLSEKQFQGLSKSVLALAGPTAQSPESLAKGMYDLVSSGFKASDALKIIDKSARAATAGLTTTEVSTKAVAAVLNAYHLGATKAGKVSDQLFQTVNLGVISFEQLAQTFGDVLPFASSLGVGLDQVGASIATMTKEGIGPEETMTRIKNVMVALLKPSDQMQVAFRKLGVESGEALIKQKGFQGALDALIGTTDGTKKAVAELFPNIRGLGGALALTGKNAAGARKDLDGMRGSAGATARALSQQSKSISFAFNQIKAEITVLAITIGSKILPPIAQATHMLRQFLDSPVGRVFITWTGFVFRFLNPVNRMIELVRLAGAAWRAFGHVFERIWNRVEKVFGDVMAAILRGFAEVFDAASHLPFIGGKFKGLADKARDAANKVDGLGENIKRLKSKDIHIGVDVGFSEAGKIVGKAFSLGRDGPGEPGVPAIMSYLSTLIGSGAAGILKRHKGKVGVLGGGPRGGLLVRIGHQLQKMGFLVGEHPAFGGVAPVHVPGSLHYSGRAIDVNWPDAGSEPAHLDQIFPMLQRLHPTQLLWRVKGHFDHLHLAFKQGGKVPGSGAGDKVPALLEPGEFVMRKKIVEALGPTFFANLNAQQLSKGGPIDTAARAVKSVGRGLSPQMEAIMLAIAGRESSWNPRARNNNPPIEDSRGLWQINTLAWPKLAKWNLYDPFVNAKAMRVVLREQGIGAWSTSRSYGGYLDEARAALARVGKGGAKARKKRIQQFRFSPRGPGAFVVKDKVDGGGSASPHYGLADRLTLADQAIERADATATKRDDTSPRQQKLTLLARKRRRLHKRLKKINKALKGTLRPSTRRRLLSERSQILSDLGSVQSEALQVGGELSTLYAQNPETLSRLTQAFRHEFGLALPAPEKAETGGGGGGPDDTKLQELNDHLKQLNELLGVQIQNTKQALNVSQSQYGVLAKAIADIANTQIGGALGLGFQSVSAPGRVASY